MIVVPFEYAEEASHYRGPDFEVTNEGVSAYPPTGFGATQIAIVDAGNLVYRFRRSVREGIASWDATRSVWRARRVDCPGDAKVFTAKEDAVAWLREVVTDADE